MITSLFLKQETGASHPRNAEDPSAIISELIGDEVMTLFDLTFFKEEGDKLTYCVKFEARWFCKGLELYFLVTEVALMIHPCLLLPTTLVCSPLIMWLQLGCVVPRQTLVHHVSLL